MNDMDKTKTPGVGVLWKYAPESITDGTEKVYPNIYRSINTYPTNG